MRAFDSWTAFLLMLFAIVGLCGLFASYATSIPSQRAGARNLLLDGVSATAGAQTLERLRPELGTLASVVIDAPGPLPDRVAQARRIVADEQQREAASIGYRTRLMLAVVTTLAGALGAGILAVARKTAAHASTNAG